MFIIMMAVVFRATGDEDDEDNDVSPSSQCPRSSVRGR